MCDAPECKGAGDLRFASLHLIGARKSMIKASLVAAGWWIEGEAGAPAWAALDDRAYDLTVAKQAYLEAEAAREFAAARVVHVGDCDAGQGGDQTG